MTATRPTIAAASALALTLLATPALAQTDDALGSGGGVFPENEVDDLLGSGADGVDAPGGGVPDPLDSIEPPSVDDPIGGLGATGVEGPGVTAPDVGERLEEANPLGEGPLDDGAVGLGGDDGL